MSNQILATAICAGCLVPISLIAGLISGVRIHGALMHLMYDAIGADL
jgi:hypothetical protein